jgi:hypothetical protein
MRQQTKLDYAFLALYVLTLILAKIDVLPGFLHFIIAIFIAFYFFISKILVKDDFKPRILISISGYVISVSLCLLSLQVFLVNRIDWLTGVMAFLALAHLIGIFYYFTHKNTQMAILHLATHSIMAFLYF